MKKSPFYVDHNAPCSPCSLLLLGLTAAIEDNSYAKCSKVKKVHNGLCEKGEWPHTITTKKQTKKNKKHTSVLYLLVKY